MILLGLGANVPSATHGTPQNTLVAALSDLVAEGVRIERRSPWYRSAPLPASDQPWFVNGVATVATHLRPAELLALLHRVEQHFGRVRRARDEPRTIDLDLLDYEGMVSSDREGVILPHPRLHERAFVLLPLRDIAPDWRHPILGATAGDLFAALPPGQRIERWSA